MSQQGDPEKAIANPLQDAANMNTALAPIRGLTNTAALKGNPLREFSYDMGYGDFYFGRRGHAEWRKARKMTRKTLMVDSNNTSESYYSNYKRLGVFPFFKLPLLIRKEILRLVVEPFTCNNDGAIRVAIHRNPDAGSDLWKETGRSHPLRPKPYYMEAFPVKKSHQHNAYTTAGKDWLMTQLLLNLSNVSARFRKELSDVFWNSTRLYCAENSHREDVFRFLEHRPSIYAGIKLLHISMDLADHDYELHTNSGYFEKFCKYISTTLKLERFSMKLRFWHDELELLASGEGPLTWLEASKQLIVTVAFKLVIKFNLDNSDDLDQDEQDEAQEELHDLYFSKIKNRLTPRSLVDAPEPQTEEEEYLHSCSPDVAATRKSMRNDRNPKASRMILIRRLTTTLKNCTEKHLLPTPDLDTSPFL